MPLPTLRAARLLAFTALAAAASAQPTPPANGPRKAEPTLHAFTNATVHTKPGETLEHATLVIQGGRIVSLTAAPAPRGDGAAPDSPAPPAGAQVHDCRGQHLYAAFIDAYVPCETPKPDPTAPGAHWNLRVMPQRSALDGAGLDGKTAEELRTLGFAAAAISPVNPGSVPESRARTGGIFRGTSAVVSLAKPPDTLAEGRPPVYLDRAYQAVSFERRGDDNERRSNDTNRWPSYPDSEMGAIALIRQTLIDADWQQLARASGQQVPPNALDSLAAPNPGTAAPVFLLFDTDDELEALRAAKIAREFNRPAAILGFGAEFRRLEAIRSDALPVILPLAFPKTPDVSTLARAESVELRDLMTWEQAPTNPRRLDAAGLKVALTTSKVPAKLGGRGKFWENLRSAIRHGLPADRALAMLTTQPAEILGVSATLGTIEPGKAANILIADGDPFDISYHRSGGRPAPRPEDPRILSLWIDGREHVIAEPKVAPAFAGAWLAIELNGKAGRPNDPNAPTIVISDKGEVTIKLGDKESKAKDVRFDRNRLDYTYDNTPFGSPGASIDSVTFDGDFMLGTSTSPRGRIHTWKAQRQPPAPQAAADKGKPTMPGTYSLSRIDDKASDPLAPDTGLITIRDDKSITVTEAGREMPTQDVTVTEDSVSYTLDMAKLGGQGLVKVTGKRTPDGLEGSMVVPDGSTHTWVAVRVDDDDVKEIKSRRAIAAIPEKYGYPFGPYALDALPPQQMVVITNATVWTSGPQGIIPDGAILFSDGKLAYVGPAAGLPRLAGEPRWIDAKGKHLTPGIIDCHSHTGISEGVNEAGQTITAEVRIQDVTNPDSVNWYRELAGGVTTVNNLHGSVNPIGGQSQTNKIRWGCTRPDDMHFEGAKPGIKFALGENVKQTHWGEQYTNRYPQTRMGVEALIRDRFTAAREYAAASDRATPSLPIHHDLELDALVEILRGERLVHCHSYRQDEILMLCRLAQEFGFKLGTFQHNLEGYKVADAVKESARGASLFSDWWNYKVEVQDAIPYAGPIMHDVGVVVSYNSDSDELARRMNIEAAKAVRYGQDLPREEALKFVTINPAIQLAIDERVGSLEVGKDADLAVWSGDPLSTTSRCERTFIDGRELFSLEQDADHRRKIAAERSRLIQKILTAGAAPEPEKKPEAKDKPDDAIGAADAWRRDYQRAALREQVLDLLRRGQDPRAARCGDCGESLVGEN